MRKINIFAKSFYVKPQIQMTASQSPNPFPAGQLTSPEWVEAIISNPDPAVRNLQITLSYHQFTLELRRLVDHENICWSGFATWASKQAGRFIRNEEVPPELLEVLGMKPDGTPAPRPWYWFLLPSRVLKSPRVLRYARLTVEDTGDQIARGNLKVYTKLARIFAGFLEMLLEQPGPDPARLEAFLNEMKKDSTTGEGLLNAFRYYYRAHSEKDPKIRAELVLAANILIGQHEQIRLQEAIEGAMNAPVRQAMNDPQRRWTSFPMSMTLRQALGWIINALFGGFIERMERSWRKVATEMIMTLGTPTGTLRLGKNVPPLPDGEQYPPVLRTLTIPELSPLMQQFDRTPDTLNLSGAKDWASLEDRLNYIVDLFRSRQQEDSLFNAPFSKEQIESISLGKKPEGPL